MALIDFTLDSVKLGMKNNVRVFIPESGRDRYPVVYFQHGLGYDETTVWKTTGIESYAEDAELMVVSSYAGASWFCNDRREGGEGAGAVLWEDYFTYELPSYIEANFPAASAAESRGQCGFSMGGYGAMMLTLLHPDRFSAVSVHSGSFIFGHEYRKDRPERRVYMQAVAPPGGRYDLFALLGRNAAVTAMTPAIRFDVGDRDHLLDQNRRFHSALVENSIEHIYLETEGSHEWAYVDQHLRDSLDFLSAELEVLKC